MNKSKALQSRHAQRHKLRLAPFPAGKEQFSQERCDRAKWAFIVREMGLDKFYMKARFPEGGEYCLYSSYQCNDSAGRNLVSCLIQEGMFHLMIIDI